LISKGSPEIVHAAERLDVVFVLDLTTGDEVELFLVDILVLVDGLILVAGLLLVAGFVLVAGLLLVTCLLLDTGFVFDTGMDAGGPGMEDDLGAGIDDDLRGIMAFLIPWIAIVWGPAVIVVIVVVRLSLLPMSFLASLLFTLVTTALSVVFSTMSCTISSSSSLDRISCKWYLVVHCHRSILVSSMDLLMIGELLRFNNDVFNLRHSYHHRSWRNGRS
jgi:hypothetical protein